MYPWGSQNLQFLSLCFFDVVCSVLGAILIIIGLYSVLWGKYKENKEKKEREAMSLPIALKESEGCQHTNSGEEINGDAKSSTAVNAGDTPEA